MSKVTKIFLIAGEASGDVLGGKLIAKIKDELKGKKFEIIGVGGDNMKKQGLKSLFDMSELSLMGFLEIIPHIPKLLKRINQTTQAIINFEPDVVVTIDSPDFCFRVIKKLNQNKITNQIKKVHFVAPTVWAYREKRAKKIAKLFNSLLVILPFESPYFTKHGLRTRFIGHPITENKIEIKNNDFRKKYKIKEDQILICLTPGSRIGEVKRILPEMMGAVSILNKNYTNLRIAIASTPKTKDLIKSELGKFRIKTTLVDQEDKIKLFDSANFAIAKSGTNTLEMSMYKLPMIVTYKTNFLTYLILKLMVKVKFANLINLILNKEIIPELLQFDCNAKDLARELSVLLDKPENQKLQIEESKAALEMLGLGSKENPSIKAAREVLYGIV